MDVRRVEGRVIFVMAGIQWCGAFEDKVMSEEILQGHSKPLSAKEKRHRVLDHLQELRNQKQWMGDRTHGKKKKRDVRQRTMPTFSQ